MSLTKSSLVNLSTSDLKNSIKNTILTNDIYITKNDLYLYPELNNYVKLTQFIGSDEINIKDFDINIINTVGLIFLKNSKYNVSINNTNYLNKRLLLQDFSVYFSLSTLLNEFNAVIINSEYYISYLDQIFVDNTYNTKLKLLITGFFNISNKNVASTSDKITTDITKGVEFTDKLADVDIHNNMQKIDIYNLDNNITKTKFIDFFVDSLRNYIGTPVGSMPFNSAFGSNFKRYLQRKANDVSYSLITEDLDSFIKLMNNEYSFRNTNANDNSIIKPIQLINIKLNELQGATSTVIEVIINLKIAQQDISLRVR